MSYVKNLCTAFLIMLFSIFGVAVADASSVEVPDRVSVTGVASMEAAPDMAELNISVNGKGATADAAAAEAASKLAKVKHALLGAGIVSDNIESMNYYLNPVYGERMKVAGYQANNMLKIKLDDISKVGRVIDKTTASGADSVNGVSFGVSNRGLLQKQLLGSAVNNAREQAAVVAEAAGRALGRLTNATIQGINDYEFMSGNALMKSARAADAEATVIEAKNVKIKVRVECSFEMK